MTMTKRQIIASQKKIDKCKVDGYFLEALLNYYYLNVEILSFISLNLNPNLPVKNIKTKEILNNLIAEVSGQSKSKGIITKKNLKMLKPWVLKMDDFFKTLKIKPPTNTKVIILECEKIFAILNISLTKILISKKK